MMMYSMFTTVMQYQKKTGIVSLIVSVAAVINIVLNYLLIPKYGGVGAACTSVVSYLFILAVSTMYLKYKKEYYFKEKYCFIHLAIVIALGIVFYFVKDTVIW